MKHALLVIEDDCVYAESLSLLLEARFRVETEPDAGKGLARLAAGAFDALILDLDLPPAIAGGGPEEGLMTARKIRESMRLTLPIAILTREIPEHMKRGLARFADAILLKSVSIDVVEKRLLELLARGAAG